MHTRKIMACMIFAIILLVPLLVQTEMTGLSNVANVSLFIILYQHRAYLD